MTGREAMRRSIAQTRTDNRMLAAAKKKAIVYVEGDSDIRFYTWATDDQFVQLQQLAGKPQVLGAIRADNSENIPGRLAIIDSDFDQILGITPYSDKNLIITDTHDMETVMYEACGYRVVEDEYIDIDSIGFGTRDGERNIWSYVVEYASQLGKLRLLSIENDWRLNFSDAEYNMKDYFHKKEDGPEFKFYGYMKHIISKSFSCQLSYEDVKEIYDKDDRTFDQWQICRGHDLSLMLAIMYSGELYGTGNVKTRDIERVLRTSYRGSRKFKKTNMFQEIKEWQRKNIGWKIRCNELC